MRARGGRGLVLLNPGGAYSIGEHVSGYGWRTLVATGDLQNLQPDKSYALQLHIAGQELKVFVDGVPVMQHLLSQPLAGSQVGLIAAGDHAISFSQLPLMACAPEPS